MLAVTFRAAGADTESYLGTLGVEGSAPALSDLASRLAELGMPCEEVAWPRSKQLDESPALVIIDGTDALRVPLGDEWMKVATNNLEPRLPAGTNKYVLLDFDCLRSDSPRLLALDQTDEVDPLAVCLTALQRYYGASLAAMCDNF